MKRTLAAMVAGVFILFLHVASATAGVEWFHGKEAGTVGFIPLTPISSVFRINTNPGDPDKDRITFVLSESSRLVTTHVFGAGGILPVPDSFAGIVLSFTPRGKPPELEFSFVDVGEHLTRLYPSGKDPLLYEIPAPDLHGLWGLNFKMNCAQSPCAGNVEFGFLTTDQRRAEVSVPGTLFLVCAGLALLALRRRAA